MGGDAPRLGPLVRETARRCQAARAKGSDPSAVHPSIGCLAAYCLFFLMFLLFLSLFPQILFIDGRCDAPLSIIPIHNVFIGLSLPFSFVALLCFVRRSVCRYAGHPRLGASGRLGQVHRVGFPTHEKKKLFTCMHTLVRSLSLSPLSRTRARVRVSALFFSPKASIINTKEQHMAMMGDNEKNDIPTHSHTHASLAEKKKQFPPQYYGSLVGGQQRSGFEEVIQRDLKRTFPDHILFR